MSLTEEYIAELRAQFPALQKTIDGRSLIYFDGPAGTQVPRSVAQAISNSLLDCNANKGGLFTTSIESDELLFQAAQSAADLVGATNVDEIVFGQNMTSLTFALSRALARNWGPDDEIIVTRLDHDANITPWQQAAEDAGAKVHYVPFRMDDYTLDLDYLARCLNSRTRLVAVGCASNATGGINPVKEICEMAHRVGALCFLDAVHFGPHGLIDVKDWDCDFLCCSAYKFFGPHTGILWGKEELLESLHAYQVRPAPQQGSGKWMTGTQSHECIMGTAACIEYLANIGQAMDEKQVTRRNRLDAAFAAISEYERDLSRQMLDGLESIEGIKIYGLTERDRLHERFPTFSIVHEHISTTRLAQALADHHIQVWNGDYYALQFVEQLNLLPEGMVRIGLVHYNTPEEVNRLVEALEQSVSSLVSL